MPNSGPAEPAPPEDGEDQADQPLTLDVLRHLVGNKWASVPGETLVVLSRDTEGNGYSPFSTYAHGRYCPTYDLTGEVYPLEGELAEHADLRELFPQIPGNACAALVLYPLG
ncbi:hypothetical protein OHB35_53250 [Streptomyces phaeochromogenes]|uniref:Uncharacterized protein n=1 Tax=Streptomyces phaeochromogenes TaxID=1923 RepID=A0ABZ1HST4_STRPH|nr:hypothetical protein [Streptomyces phaeochromogenes]WSD11744.1 hypothetical protein OHB35_00085 [Streptomyces phaeochromogenes]WSD21305.1 hypothetical protein OHB35_53250 [Streptomyces phaeochromogenes]